MSFRNLTNFLKNTSPSFYLLLIVILGFILRIINLTVGFPILYMSNDEAVYHLSALNMIATRTPFTIGDYGPLGAYTQIPFLLLSFLILIISGKVVTLADLELLLVTHEGYFLFIPRIISALFGILTIIAAYKLSKELFAKREIALFSALLTTISFNLVHISHLGRAWSPAIFFAIVAAIFAVKAVKRINDYEKFICYSLIFCAISFGFHQFGGLVVVLVFLISLNAKMSFGEYLKRNLPALAVFTSLIFLFNYLSLGVNIFNIFNPNYSKDTVHLVSLPSASGVFLKTGEFLKNLFLTDFVIAAFFVFFITRRIARSGIFLSFTLFSFINMFLVVLIFPSYILRYFLIAFSFLPILAGWTFYEVFQRTRSLLVVFIIVILAMANSIYFNLLITREGTFSQVRKWLDSNVSLDTPVIATTHRNLGYVPNAQATSQIRKTKEGYYLRAAKLVGTGYPNNVRFIIYANELAKSGESKTDYTLDALKYYKSNLIIDSYMEASDRLIKKPTSLKLKLVAHFSPTGDKISNVHIPEALFDPASIFPLFELERPGPYIDVLEVMNK